MLDTLIFLAATVGDTPTEATGPISEIAGEFGVQWEFLIPQIINFLIVAVALWYLAFKPVIKTMGLRQKRIQQGFQYADEMEAKLAAAEEERANTIRQAQLETQRIIAEAREGAKEIIDKATQDAVHRSEALIRKGEQAVEQERAKMLADVRKEVADLVILTTSKVLGEQLTDEQRGNINRSAAAEVAKNN